MSSTVDRPDVLDDAEPKTITPSKLKAFFDEGLVESMSRERWGASKWACNQPRFGSNEPSEADVTAGADVDVNTECQLAVAAAHPDSEDPLSLGVGLIG